MGPAGKPHKQNAQGTRFLYSDRATQMQRWLPSRRRKNPLWTCKNCADTRWLWLEISSTLERRELILARLPQSTSIRSCSSSSYYSFMTKSRRIFRALYSLVVLESLITQLARFWQYTRLMDQ